MPKSTPKKPQKNPLQCRAPPCRCLLSRHASGVLQFRNVLCCSIIFLVRAICRPISTSAARTQALRSDRRLAHLEAGTNNITGARHRTGTGIAAEIGIETGRGTARTAVGIATVTVTGAGAGAGAGALRPPADGKAAATTGAMTEGPATAIGATAGDDAVRVNPGDQTSFGAVLCWLRPSPAGSRGVCR